MKKTVHIISHSHLDREWYMPFEAHRMRVVELFDTVLDLFDKDEEFKYFHVDGHTLPLNDYLEVRPLQRNKLKKVIEEGKLRIGPYYILQDAFLISEEANVRNALIGHQELQQWGVKGEQIGYFPDTFGLSGQIPQIVKGTGMHSAAFGRGVKPTGFNNVVGESANFQSTYSEMKWQSPSGDEVLGILFANWYSNGNEIPTDELEAKRFWEQKLSDVEKYAATDQLLMMNGCDHQPVQTDLSQAIRVANKLFPDYHFIHSNFTDYLAAISKDDLEKLSTIKGELRSQETDGWYTLANTASSRIYLKQRSHRLSQRLEQVIEPLSVLAKNYDYPYPAEKIDFAWKLLLQNYPHDSICGCSVDIVHRGMMTRFDQVEAILDYLENELQIWLSKYEFATPAKNTDYTFQVWNTTPSEREHISTVKIELARCTFKEASPEECYQRMEDLKFGNWKVIDSEGNQIPAVIKDKGVSFNYDLPKDAFRVPYMGRYAEVSIALTNLAPFSVNQFYLVINDDESEEIKNSKKESIENKRIKLTIESNGLVSIYDKENVQAYYGQCLIEDSGDSGNEYIFKEAVGSRIYSTDKIESINYYQSEIEQRIEVDYIWKLPKEGDSQLKDEIKKVIDITKRTSKRSNELIEQSITVCYSLSDNDQSIRVFVKGNNEVKDHRIRMIWTLPQSSPTHYADSHYEIVERNNKVSTEWKNPSNPQVLRHAVAIYGEDNLETRGLTIMTNGLYEYEVTNENNSTVLAVTLLRCTGELGDWGHFATPEAQCEGEFTAELAIRPWVTLEKMRESLIDARYQFVPFMSYAAVNQKKETADLVAENNTWFSTFFKCSLPKTLVITAVKQSIDNEGTIIRFVNLSNQQLNLSDYVINPERIKVVNLIEQIDEREPSLIINSHQIKTVKI